MNARRRSLRCASAAAALVASLAVGSCAGAGDAPGETGVVVDARQQRVESALPGSRADVSVVRSGLARHFAVTVYTPIRPTSAGLRRLLVAIAGMLPEDVSALELDVRTPTRAPWDLGGALHALGIADSALHDHGGGFTLHGLAWFRAAFGG